MCGAIFGEVPQCKKGHLSRKRLVEVEEFGSLEQGDQTEMLLLQADDCAAPSASQRPRRVAPLKEWLMHDRSYVWSLIILYINCSNAPNA